MVDDLKDRAFKRSVLNPLSMAHFNRTYKNIGRIRKILAVLARHGFFQLIESMGLARLIPFSKRWKQRDVPLHTIPERLCTTFEELGPSFIKLGQMFASRPDLVTPTFSKAFERLRDDVKPIPFSQIRHVVENEFEGTLESLFDHFEEKSLAAASIAQVHRATREQERQVVVKVQRPQIEKVIQTDLSILYLFAKLAEKYVPEVAFYDPVAVVEEFARTVKSATDFIEEAHNIDAIRANFSDSQEVYIPEIFWELTSKRVLTMEWIDGIPIHDIERLKRENYDLKKICEVGVEAFFRQVFIHGLFHADLHGGNILVLPGNRVAFVDFGEVGRVGSNTQTALANLFVALLSKDFYTLAREYLDLGTPQGPIDLGKFADDLEKFLAPLYGRKISGVQLGDILSKAAGIASQHRIRLPRDLVLLARVIFTVEDLIRKLDPDFDLLKHGGKFASELVKQKLRPDKLARDLVWNLRDLGGLSRELPTQLKYIIQKLSNNELSLVLDIRNLGRGINELDRASNRIAFSVVIAGLVIGSSVLTFVDRGPHYYTMPVLGLAGYIIAGVLGIGLLISILRSRRL